MPVVINSRFTPLTYDEITRPLIEQTQAQEALENAYMEASDQASQIMAQANEQTDPIAYARLKNYSEALQQQAESLMRQGLNRNSRQSLINMRRRYNQDIVPVQAAVKRRNELMQERHQLRLTHPDILQERDVISVDDLLRNPNMDLGATLYGSDLSKRAAALTSAITRGRQSVSLGQNLDKYTQTVLSQSGLTADEIQAALAGDDTPVSKALHSLYTSTGVDNWKNNAAKQSVWNYISEGAMQGVGEFRVGTQSDQQAKRNDEISDRNANMLARGFRPDGNGGYEYDPVLAAQIATGRKGATRGDKSDHTENDLTYLGKDVVSGKDIWKDSEGILHMKSGKDFYKVDDPNQVILNNQNNNIKLTSKEAKLASSPIVFIGGDEDDTFGISERSSLGDTNKAEEVSREDLTEKQKSYIDKKLSDMGLLPNVVTIYRIKEVGRDRYIVRLKGYNAAGEYVGVGGNSNQTSSSTTKTTTNNSNSTTVTTDSIPVVTQDSVRHSVSDIGLK